MRSSDQKPLAAVDASSTVVSAAKLEREIKLEGEPEALERAFASLEGTGASSRNQSSVYFDTPAGALWEKGRVLRVRRSSGRYLLTLKWPHAGTDTCDVRNELEVRCPGEQPDIALLGPEMADEISKMAGGAPLLPRFTTQIRRRVLIVGAGASTIEVALDTGHIQDGDAKLPVREIEIELKQGDPANLYEFAEQLSAAYNLRLGVLTKSQRGFLLAAEDLAPVRRALSPGLASDMRLDDLIGVAIAECIDHFVSNWPALLQSDNPDAIHQMRVAIRRLRALLKIFHRAIAHPKFAAFRREAQDIATALGIARDTDVFIGDMDKGPFRDCMDEASVEAFRKAAQERREEGYGQAHAMLAAPQTTRFVLELRAFVARRGWQDGLGTPALIDLGEPAVKFSAHALDRMDRKLRSRGKAIDELTSEQRHELRIVLKNIRYSAEMFAALFTDAHAAKKYNRAAGRLQDALGAYNDAANASAIVADIERRAGPKSARAAGMVAGWTARGLTAADTELKRDVRDFRKAQRFWK